MADRWLRRPRRHATRSRRLARRVRRGLVDGIGYFVAGLWWVGAACLVDADKFIWALPLGVVVLPAALAFFPALGFTLAWLVWSPRASRVFALAFGLGLSEWARGLLLTGFPWNDVGMALGANLMLAQFASVVGLHGLTFLAISIFAAPATMCRPGEGRLVVVPTILAALAMTLLASFGFFRLQAPPSATVSGAKLRIIQPNISQGASFSPENKDAILRRYFALSSRSTSGAAGARVTHLIWPESAFPFILSRDAEALGAIADISARRRDPCHRSRSGRDERARRSDLLQFHRST